MENILLPHFQPIRKQLIQKRLFLILRLITICKKPFNSLPNFAKQSKKQNFPLFPFHLTFAVWTYWRKSCPSTVLAPFLLCVSSALSVAVIQWVGPTQLSPWRIVGCPFLQHRTATLGLCFNHRGWTTKILL